MLNKHEITQGLAHFYRQADAQTINRIRDWKILAPEAQDQMVSLMRGILPVFRIHEEEGSGQVTEPRPLRTNTDAAIGRLILHTAMAVMERAYPASIYAKIEMQDPLEMIAMIAGVHPDQLDLEDEDEHPGYANGNGRTR